MWEAELPPQACLYPVSDEPDSGNRLARDEVRFWGDLGRVGWVTSLTLAVGSTFHNSIFYEIEWHNEPDCIDNP